MTPGQRAAFANVQSVNREFELLTFKPSPVFFPLMEEVWISKRILIRAANRVGKTRHCAWVVAKRMVETPGYRVRIVGPTNDHIHNVLGQYLADFLTPYLAAGSYYVTGKGWNGGRTRIIRLRNGSICELRSLMDNPDAHSGRSLHMVVFDEVPTVAHYTENAARLVDTLDEPGGGVMIIAATMVNRPANWLREMAQGLGQPDAPPGRTLHDTGWVQWVAVFNRKNCPWYSESQVVQWTATMQSSPWQWGQRIEAAWDGVTVDRIFVGVNEDVFERAPPPGSVRVGIGIDHGEVAGHQCAILMAYSSTRVWVIDEYVSATSTSPEEDAREILRMLTRHNVKPTAVDLAIGDLNTGKGFAGYRINEAIEVALAQQTDRRVTPFHILAPDKTPGSVDWGLRCINYAARRGDLRVHPRCLNLTATLKHWRGGKTGEDGKLSHACDAFRYILTAAIGQHVTYAQLRFT